MPFNWKTAKDIDENDLLSLIGASWEGQSIDFKKSAYPPPPDDALPSDQGERDRVKNRWKIDLCTDLSALANARGGWIICGIKEKGGVAEVLCGLGANVNLESEISRLEQCAMNGIDPPLPALKIEPVKLEDPTKAAALVIRVPRSYRAPHRVRETRKFHVRRSGRNGEMKMDELRMAFNLSESLVERVRDFRNTRIEALATNRQEDIPILLNPGVKCVLHAIPLTSLDVGSTLDLSAFNSPTSAPWIVQENLHFGRYNLLGYVRPNGLEESSRNLDGYIQVFRNGAVECVETVYMAEHSIENAILLETLEHIIITYLETALLIQKNLGVSLPIVIMVSVLGVKDTVLTMDRRRAFRHSDHRSIPLYQDRLLIPDTLVEDYETDPRIAAKPILDILWNAAGWDRSLSYDEHGNWINR